jgi:phage I-like protein
MLTARACNVALSEGGVPDWIQLLPPGPAITGQDGRAWQLPDPIPLIAAFQHRHTPLVIDWEHASEHRAPQGLDAPAAGWVDQLETREGAIWGHVEWTDRAKQQIAAKEYRFLSPVFTYQKADSTIIALTSAGLTNQPNLNLTALNQELFLMNDDLLERLRYLLNLPTLATVEEIIAELERLKARITAAPVDTAGNRATLLTLMDKAMNQSPPPDIDKFIPRADYDAALARAGNAEARLKEISAAEAHQAIETALNTALTAGQISPATVEFYRAGCQQEGGLERFQIFLKTAPPLLGDKPNLGDKPLPSGSTPETEFAANAELRAEFGTVDIYKAYRAAVDHGRATILGAKT